MIPRPRLVCLGNLTLDDVVLPDNRIVPGCIGGDALYAALAARLYDPSAEMVAPVGQDFPAAVLARIDQAGLSRVGLTCRPQNTLHNRIDYRSDGGRSWTTYFTEAEFHALSPVPNDIPPSYREAKAFMILAMTLAAQEALVADLKRTSTALVALDPQEDYISGNEDALRRLIGAVDIFMPSADEVRQLLGHTDWIAAAKTFAGWGPSIVVIKLAAEGCLIYGRDDDRAIRIPSLATDVRDTTGAGDCFCGAFVAALIDDRADLRSAGRAGTVAASFAIEDFGVERLIGLPPELAAQRLRDWGAK